MKFEDVKRGHNYYVNGFCEVFVLKKHPRTKKVSVFYTEDRRNNKKIRKGRKTTMRCNNLKEKRWI